MAVLSEDVSKLTDRYQTTVPAGIRNQLRLGRGDRIRYRIEMNGRVYIERMPEADADPALGPFLSLLEADIGARPEHLRAFDSTLHDRLQALVGDVEIDLDGMLSPDDE